MNASAFDRYLERSSALHRLDARVKVVLTLVFIVSVAQLPERSWAAYAAATLMLVFAALAGQLSPWLIARRSLIGVPFLLAAVTLLFMPGQTVWQGPFGPAVSDAGLARFTGIVLRSLISLQAAALLSATTRFPDVLHALRHLRCPKVLVSIIRFMYRYLFVLAEEAQRLIRARAARSGRLPAVRGGGSLGWRAAVTGHMAGQLLVRSLDRSDRVFQAMQARGYRGEPLTLAPHEMRPADWIALASGVAAIAILQIIGRV